MRNISCATEEKSVSQTLTERGKRYGQFKDHAALSQNLKTIMKGHTRWHLLDADQREALEMIQHKIARIINGDPNYADSWHDIGGYAKLIDERLTNAKL